MFPATFAVAPNEAETVASRNQRKARERRSDSRASQSTESSHGDQSPMPITAANAKFKWWKAKTSSGSDCSNAKSSSGASDVTSLQRMKSQSSDDSCENSVDVPIRRPPASNSQEAPIGPLNNTPRRAIGARSVSKDGLRTDSNTSQPRRPPDISAPLPPLPQTNKSPDLNPVSPRSAEIPVMLDRSSDFSYESHSSQDSEAYLSLNERIANLEIKLQRQPSLRAEEATLHFAKFLSGISNSRASVIANRLSESLESSLYKQEAESFTDRLWSLLAYERLFQGRQVQKHVHEMLHSNTRKGGRRLLNLYGCLADGWLLAEKYPFTTVYTVTNQSVDEPSNFLAPPNHHSLYVPAERPQLPFGSSFFDVVISRTMATNVTEDLWPLLLREALRVLKPSGLFESLSIDPHLDCEGEALKTWVDSKLVAELDSCGMCTSPSSMLLEHAKATGFRDVQRARIALPVMAAQQSGTSSKPDVDDEPNDATELTRMMTLTGRAFYRSSFAAFTRSQSCFWFDKGVGAECREKQPRIVLTIMCGRKGLRA